jgi:Zn-dependent M28 family amino/carboxypeptidase
MNILAEQQGVRFPLQKYILCAHYDATADDTRDSVAPGADDNATGVAAVLEAARLVSRYNTDYTVLYALWDCEEVGAFGSDAYAMTARARGDSILGVINLDMLGTDTNNDSLMYVASGTAREIADTVAQLCQLYHVGLKPRLVFPGIESSDHASFIRQKYRAMMLIEYLNTDFSPVNHTSLDRIAMLNLDYFHRQAKLAVLTIAFLAGVGPLSSVAVTNNVAWAFCLEQNYPNPFNPSTTIKFELPKSSDVRLGVYDMLGREVSVLVNERRNAGVHEVKFDASGLSSGVYFYRLQAGHFVQTRKLLFLR